MKKHPSRDAQPAKMRYHILGPDNLYAPIPFLFVTDRMSKEIADERQLILNNMQSAEAARQLKVFAKYNPKHSATAFNAVLRLFAVEAQD